MNLNLVVVVSLFAAVPMIAYVRKDGPAAEAPKLTMTDVQKLFQTISSDPAKLKDYRDMGKLQEQMQQAEEKEDSRAIELSTPRLTASCSKWDLNT